MRITLALLATLLSTTAQAGRSLPTLYTLHCSGCHGEAGHGVPEQGIPDLHDAGLYAEIPAGRAYLAQVPGLTQSRLDNATAAQMLNYVLSRFASDRLSPRFKPYTEAEIAPLRAAGASDASRRRLALLAHVK